MYYQEKWARLFLPLSCQAWILHLEKELWKCLLPLSLHVSVPVCFDLETKGTEFCQELQKADQITPHGSNTNCPMQSDPFAY